jgi:gamma-D-glutamyl-L-lysine dipeptidyl-peptidase
MRYHIVTTPVADVRHEPIASTLIRAKDPLQETQVLYNDIVEVIAEKDGWLQVSVPDQPVFDKEQCWKGYPGWVEKKQLTPIEKPPQVRGYVTKKWTVASGIALSMGTKLFESIPSITQDDPKKAIVVHVGDPYLWGGLSSYDPSMPAPLTGVDCSGLVYLYYRLQGIIIPRNASDQFRVVDFMQGKSLQQGDLIFLHNLASNRVDHVMLYWGDDQIFESTMRSNTVRIISSHERIGRSITEVDCGYHFDGFEFYFGKLKSNLSIV